MAGENGFQLGDRVQLRSGGPLMTVGEVSDDGSIWCEWFDSKGELKANSFKPHSLAKVRDRSE
jgi:uncharacterized protein YodC (DUF2158 family)